VKSLREDNSLYCQLHADETQEADLVCWWSAETESGRENLLDYCSLIPTSSVSQLNQRHLRLVTPRQDCHISLLVDSGVWGRNRRSLQVVSYVSKSGIVAVWDGQNG
jgi:hypothetical protein